MILKRRNIIFLTLFLLLLTSCSITSIVLINDSSHNKNSGLTENSKSLVLSTYFHGNPKFQHYRPKVVNAIRDKLIDQGFSTLDTSKCNSCVNLIVAFDNDLPSDRKLYNKLMTSFELTEEGTPLEIGATFWVHVILIDNNEKPIFYLKLLVAPQGEFKFVKGVSVQEQIDKITLDRFFNYMTFVFLGELIEAALGQSNKTVYEFLIDAMTNDSLSLEHRSSAAYNFHSFVVGQKNMGIYSLNQIKKYAGYTFMFTEDEMKNSQGLEAMYTVINALKTTEPDLIDDYQESIEKLKRYSTQK